MNDHFTIDVLVDSMGPLSSSGLNSDISHGTGLAKATGHRDMNRERLMRLAALLEAYRDQGAAVFDLRGWGEFTTRPAGFLWLEQRSCNTAACAVGLACVSGIFAADGLSFEADNTGRLSPVFREMEGWDAVKAFFQLEHDQAVRLFAEDSYDVTTGEAAARAVAARIREAVTPTASAI